MAVSRVDRSRYDFREANKSEFLLDGWARPETAANGELTFAWATSRQASIKLAVFDPDSRWLHFRSRASALSTAAGQTVSVRVNGQAIGSVELVAGRFQNYVLPIPGEVVTLGDNLISFSFSATGIPAGADSTARDTRTLAAAFDYVAMTHGAESGAHGVAGRPATQRRSNSTAHRYRVGVSRTSSRPGLTGVRCRGGPAALQR